MRVTAVVSGLLLLGSSIAAPLAVVRGDADAATQALEAAQPLAARDMLEASLAAWNDLNARSIDADAIVSAGALERRAPKSKESKQQKKEDKAAKKAQKSKDKAAKKQKEDERKQACKQDPNGQQCKSLGGPPESRAEKAKKGFGKFVSGASRVLGKIFGGKL